MSAGHTEQELSCQELLPTMPVDSARRALGRWRKHALILAIDLWLAALSTLLSIFILQGNLSFVEAEPAIKQALGAVLLFRILALVYFRVFQTSIRYPSILDLLRVIEAAALSSVLCFAWFHFLLPASGLRLTLFVLDGALLEFLWGGLHCGARVYRSAYAAACRGRRRALIVGAGDAGQSLVRELSSEPGVSLRAVAVVDDNPALHGTFLYGAPVLGGIEELASVARRTQAEEVLLCVPSATQSQMNRILAICREASLPVRTLPTLAELADGKVSGRHLRKLTVSDLLQRPEVHHGPEEIEALVSGKTVLVTGAGGSIGSELSRQLASGNPARLLLLDKSENSLFYVHREIRERFPKVPVRPLLIDLTCRQIVEQMMGQEAPELILHAAAHKHVGLLESHPLEAVRNNVIGIRNIGMAAVEAGSVRFVNISSDKAVNPRNYMGASKRITEIFVQEVARKYSARFMNVRFGNVAGSTGSVLRLFWDQIQKGGPLLVTDPRAERYFMSIPEAIYLILQAAGQGNGGETFVFEMGKPVNIYELAKSMSLLAGFVPGKDVAIHFVGLQQGEKFTEQLWEDWELPRPTSRENIRVISRPHPLSSAMLENIERMEAYLKANDSEGLCAYLGRLIPEFAASRNVALAQPTEPHQTKAAVA
jgi:FlaA1/EpsC-like NDP-sugar epimerase